MNRHEHVEMTMGTGTEVVVKTGTVSHGRLVAST